MSEMAVCNRCGLPKPLDDFYIGKNKGVPYRRKICKVCHRLPSPRKIQLTPLQSVSMKRPASIDCAFTCPTCGMGTETEAEALECCKRAAG